LLLLIVTLVFGENLLLSNTINHNSVANSGSGNSDQQSLRIVNVWSHDGSPISGTPPTPTEKNVFLTTENIYVVIKTTGIGGKKVRIYIVENEAWKNKTVLVDVSGGYEEIEIVATESPQYHGPILVWKAPLTVGRYDIVVDENLNGERDPGEKVDDSDVIWGVFVIHEIPLGTLMTMMASLLATATYRKFKRLK